MYLNSQSTDSQSGVITVTPTEPTVSLRHRKAFSNLQLCMTDSSWIHLILLIKLIQYKIGKTRLFWLFDGYPLNSIDLVSASV